MQIIDSHIHCGIQKVSQPFEAIQPLLARADIQGACLFAPVEDIYHRYHAFFDDNDQWRRCRQRAHDYLLSLSEKHAKVYPYYFVWNDFAVEDLERGFMGIKWHHHDGEPEYRYADPRCRAMIEAICERGLPVVLEETFDHTLLFLKRIRSRTVVIIPHLGMLNGGFERLLAAGVWQDPEVYADTALAGRQQIAEFVTRFGPHQLLFGSDYPFGDPGDELDRIFSLGFSDEELAMICAGNIRRLLGIAG
jgi:hypothetical protein